MTRALGDDARDLLLGGRCVGCGRGGRVLCEDCEATLPREGFLVATAAGRPCAAAGSYDAVLREAVVGHKERRLVRLRPRLGALLAVAVATLMTDLLERSDGPVLLVPVPSRAATVRARGYEPTRAITTEAARRLRLVGIEAAAAPLLRSRPGVVDQAGLDAAARWANVTGSMAGSEPHLRRAARRGPAHVVVCDDVVTTGSTLAEALRALGACGVGVLGVAVVAATPRRSHPPAVDGAGRGAGRGAGQIQGDSSAPALSRPPPPH